MTSHGPDRAGPGRAGPAWQTYRIDIISAVKRRANVPIRAIAAYDGQLHIRSKVRRVNTVSTDQTLRERGHSFNLPDYDTVWLKKSFNNNSEFI